MRRNTFLRRSLFGWAAAVAAALVGRGQASSEPAPDEVVDLDIICQGDRVKAWAREYVVLGYCLESRSTWHRGERKYSFRLMAVDDLDRL